MSTEQRALEVMAELMHRVGRGEHYEIAPDWEAGTATVVYLGKNTTVYTDTDPPTPIPDEDYKTLGPVVCGQNGWPSSLGCRPVTEMVCGGVDHTHIGDFSETEAEQIEAFVRGMHDYFCRGMGWSRVPGKG